MQKFFSEPKSDLSGWYVVASKDFTTGKITPLKGEEFPNEELAKARANELNKLNNDDNMKGGLK